MKNTICLCIVILACAVVKTNVKAQGITGLFPNGEIKSVEMVDTISGGEIAEFLKINKNSEDVQVVVAAAENIGLEWMLVPSLRQVAFVMWADSIGCGVLSSDSFELQRLFLENDISYPVIGHSSNFDDTSKISLIKADTLLIRDLQFATLQKNVATTTVLLRAMEVFDSLETSQQAQIAGLIKSMYGTSLTPYEIAITKVQDITEIDSMACDRRVGVWAAIYLATSIQTNSIISDIEHQFKEGSELAQCLKDPILRKKTIKRLTTLELMRVGNFAEDELRFVQIKQVGCLNDADPYIIKKRLKDLEGFSRKYQAANKLLDEAGQ